MIDTARHHRSLTHVAIAGLGIACVLCLALAPLPARAEDTLRAIGGPGGGAFTARCPEGQLLTGFELRTGDDVDAVRPMCVSALGGAATSAASPSDWHGGNGGSPRYVLCPARIAPIVTGMKIAAEGVDTVIVNTITLSCGSPDGTAEPRTFDEASFDGPAYRGDFGGKYSEHLEFSESCPRGQMVIGAHGRSGRWLDALGLICGQPQSFVSAIGRVGPSSPSPAPRPICEAARDARARSSPVAADLEAQCAASKITVPSIGRVGGAPSAPHPRRSICDSAADARERNSPAAANLEAQCRASKGP